MSASATPAVRYASGTRTPPSYPQTVPLRRRRPSTRRTLSSREKKAVARGIIRSTSSARFSAVSTSAGSHACHEFGSKASRRRPPASRHACSSAKRESSLITMRSGSRAPPAPPPLSAFSVASPYACGAIPCDVAGVNFS